MRHGVSRVPGEKGEGNARTRLVGGPELTAQVKCDGRLDGCRNCERLELDCLGDGVGAAAAAAGGGGGGAGETHEDARGREASPPRKIRTYRSCQSCRLSKTKCNGVRPCCGRCAAKRLECLYDGGSAPRWTSSLTKSLSPDPAGAEPRRHSSPLPRVAPTRPASASGRKRTRPAGSDDGLALSAASHPLTWYVRPRSTLVRSALSSSRLLSPDLPSSRNLRRVVEQYFANVHPLRCFAFVHKPSFMRQLDKGLASDDESALLHVICAHGAR